MFRDLPIQRKMATAILLTSMVTLVLALLSLFAYEFNHYKANAVDHVHTVARIIAANSSAPLIYDDRKVAHEILSGLRGEPDIVAAALYDAKGVLFAAYPTNVAAGTFPARVNALPPIKSSARRYQFSEEVSEGNRKAGTLYIKARLDLYPRMGIYAIVLLLVLGAAGAVALFLSNVFQKHISQPILDLANTARLVSERKDYTLRAPKTSGDELGTLAEAFNGMLSEIWRSQGALRESEQRFRVIADAVPVLIWISDTSKARTWFNRAWLEFTGRSMEQELGQGWQESVHPDDLTRYIRVRDEAFTARERFRIEYRLRYHDGSFRWVLANGIPRLDGAKSFIGYLGACTDIQEMIEAREVLARDREQLEALVDERTRQLQEVITELESFSYSISHDVRAPLRAITNFSGILIEEYGETLDPRAADYLRRIETSSRRLDKLIQDILLYSRVAKQQIRLEPVALEPLLTEIISNSPEFQPPRANVRLHPPLLPVLANEAYLTQCISNLLGNAVKFVAPNTIPTVDIRTERVGDHVRIWFEDNGIGIDPEHYNRIFQIFGRVYSEKKYEGTGIGLSIVKKAVERMGGEIGLDSALGRGTKFWLKLKAVA